MSVSRRTFVAGAAAAGVLAGTSIALADEAAVPATEAPAFLTKPEVPTDIVDEQDCDVLVIGMGLAGTAAFKAAAETGVKTIALEKQPEDTYSVIYMAGDFGVVGSQIQKDLGIEWAPKEVIMHEMQKECASRIDPWMLSYWYDHSGVDFDWFVEGSDFEVLKGTAAEKETDKEYYIRPKCFPRNEGYDYREEFYPYFHGTITTNPNMQWACQAAMDAGVAAGGQIIFGAAGEQLIQDEDGTVTGAYAKTDAGYIKVNAKQVVLTCGDYGANSEMVRYYAPEYADYGGGVDTGDGHLMGIWAGGRMENGPHAPMAHHMGAALGVDSYLPASASWTRTSPARTSRRCSAASPSRPTPRRPPRTSAPTRSSTPSGLSRSSTCPTAMATPRTSCPMTKSTTTSSFFRALAWATPRSRWWRTPSPTRPTRSKSSLR